jgi:xylulokinase
MYGLGHENFASILQKTKPGNGGLFLLPWYGGERTPDLPNGTPLYFGFDLNDFTKEKLCRAVLEGHILNLYEGYQRISVQAKTIYLTGGIAKSKAWRQTIADVFNCEVMPVKGEGAALGAAVHAVYVDHKKTIKDVFAFVRPFIEYDLRNKTKPIRENVKVYDSLKKIYAALSKRVRGIRTQEDPFFLRVAFRSQIV